MFPQTEFQKNECEKSKNWLAWPFLLFLKFPLELLEYVRDGHVPLSSLWKSKGKGRERNEERGLGEKGRDAVGNVTTSPATSAEPAKGCAVYRNPKKHCPLICCLTLPMKQEFLILFYSKLVNISF